eukprot:7829161-Ditylum_brightwellii.AAC.1
MSKCHIKLSRAWGSLRILKEDEISNVAEQVWRELPSCKVALAYVQAYRIARKVIEAKGSNNFLGVG